MTKIVDNFPLIRSLLDFPTSDTFYFGQIIVRRKDIPTIGADNRIIRDLYFESLEKFDKREAEIKGMCDYFGARAYLHLNKRSKKAVALECLKIMADHISKDEFQSLRSVYATACGQKVNDPEKKWILDIDFDNPDAEKMLLNLTTEVLPFGPKILTTIPTVNGKHYISKPFDLNSFERQARLSIEDNNYFGVEYSIQKNNPTLLYYGGGGAQCKI